MKTIVIASGKGGTGKTTLTALFAHHAARNETVVVADADVEASNLPLALHAHTEGCWDFAGGQVANINPRTCSSCGLCASICRFDAVEQSASATGETVYRVDPWRCEGCGYCERVCAVGAIAMETKSAGVACVGTGDTGPVVFGRLGPGEDLSGKLVTEVRERATRRSTEVDADLLLIDGPPGIGCPVIASVSNADLLVAVTEPSAAGEHDLRRLVELAGRFGLPVTVLLNKADLAPEGAQRIRDYCDRSALELIAEVPFDHELASLATRLADEGAGEPLAAMSGRGFEAATAAWDVVRGIVRGGA